MEPIKNARKHRKEYNISEEGSMSYTSFLLE
jgi:hypothetical protein